MPSCKNISVFAKVCLLESASAGALTGFQPFKDCFRLPESSAAALSAEAVCGTLRTRHGKSFSLPVESKGGWSMFAQAMLISLQLLFGVLSRPRILSLATVLMRLRLQLPPPAT